MDQSKHIAERASAYFAQSLHESDAQRREREAWLTDDVRHARAYARRGELWRRAGGLGDDAELQAIMASDLAALRRSRWTSHPRWLLAAAAVVLVTCGVGWTLWSAGQVTSARYATALGERRTENLVDGTRIVLNTDTVVEVRYTRSRRDVELKHGEAQFDVAHDTSRPFVVNMGVGTVTALGTRFQVRRDGAADAVVTLLKGSVKVSQGRGQRILHPDEQARLSAHAAIDVRTIAADDVDGWLEGRLQFRNTPLGEVVAEANRYSSRKLRLGDPGLADLAISGNFPTGDTASIALAVEQILPVRVDERDDEIVLRRK
jgi:transmembrane sensor